MSLNMPSDAEYEIEPELRARNLLEQHTTWQSVISRNDDRYGWDLEYHKWIREDGQWVKKHLGYIEVEHARKWYGKQIPENWVFYSFLERKIREWDDVFGKFMDMKEDYERTIYLKFNQEFTSCFAAAIGDIQRDGELTYRSDGSREGTFRKLDIDHQSVHIGVDACAEFICDFMEDDRNSTLSSFTPGMGDDD